MLPVHHGTHIKVRFELNDGVNKASDLKGDFLFCLDGVDCLPENPELQVIVLPEDIEPVVNLTKVETTYQNITRDNTNGNVYNLTHVLTEYEGLLLSGREVTDPDTISFIAKKFPYPVPMITYIDHDGVMEVDFSRNLTIFDFTDPYETIDENGTVVSEPTVVNATEEELERAFIWRIYDKQFIEVKIESTALD